MICEACRDQCSAGPGMCGPLDYADLIVAAELGMGDIDAVVEAHQRTDHAMPLDGAVYRCKAGHTKDAAPADVMRAAGLEPML